MIRPPASARETINLPTSVSTNDNILNQSTTEHKPFIGNESLSSASGFAINLRCNGSAIGSLKLRQASFLAFRSRASIFGIEHGNTSNEQSSSRPAVLDDEVFKHVVGNADTVDMIDVLDETVVCSSKNRLFQMCTVVEGNFFSVRNESGMSSTEISLKRG